MTRPLDTLPATCPQCGTVHRRRSMTHSTLCRPCVALANRRRRERYAATRDRYGPKTCCDCGGMIAASNAIESRCSTCCRPVQVRADYFARITAYAERAAAGLPLFPEGRP